MIFQSVDEAEKYSGEPEPGDMAWLWFKPGSGKDSSLYPAYNAYCPRCDVHVVIGPTLPQGACRCWCCGRFIERPKGGWNPHQFRNTGPGYSSGLTGPPPITPTNSTGGREPGVQQQLEEL